MIKIDNPEYKKATFLAIGDIPKPDGCKGTKYTNSDSLPFMFFPWSLIDDDCIMMSTFLPRSKCVLSPYFIVYTM